MAMSEALCRRIHVGTHSQVGGGGGAAGSLGRWKWGRQFPEDEIVFEQTGLF